MLFGFLVLERSSPCQEPADVDVKLEELLLVMGVKSQLDDLPLKQIRHLHRFALGLCLFEVTHKLSSFHKFFPEMGFDLCFVQFEGHDPVEVLVSGEVLDLLWKSKQVSVSKFFILLI